MKFNEGRKFMGRLEAGNDLLEGLSALCRQEGLRTGFFWVIGAVTSARLGYYDQKAQRYLECLSLDRKLELSSCQGNISLMDDTIFLHCHATLAGWDGVCYGGHLMPGTIVFAAEYYIQELSGEVLKRKFDPKTGLRISQHANISKKTSQT